MRIPKNIQHLYENKAVYTKSLQTTCIKTARHRRDQLLAVISKQKEQSIGGGRATFLSFYSSLTEAKRELSDNDYLNPYNQLDTSILVGTELHSEIQRDAKKSVDTGIIPIEYSYTLREAVNDWTLLNKHKNKDTLIKVKSTSERFLRYINQYDIPLLAIGRLSVVGFIEELIIDYSPSTVAGHLSRLKTLYRHAWSMAKIDKKDNPFESHTLSHYGTTQSVEKKQLFDREQIKQILNWAGSEADNINLLVLLGLYTGCRIGELCSLTKDDVFDDGNCIALYIRKGKTNAAQRTVPLPMVIHNLIRNYLNSLDPNTALLLGFETKTASRIFSRFKVNNISKDKSLCFHSFRVHMSTAYSRANVKEQTASFIIGHSGDSKTMTYGYYAKADELKELAEAVEKAALIIKRDWL